MRVADVREHYPHFIGESDSFSSGHIRSWIGAPLLAHGEVLGMMALDRSEVRPFTLEEEQLVVTMANHVAGAVRNALLYHRQVEYEQELLEANRQKETLLRELHHRVKNNLQLVSSLIKLRSDGLSDADARDALDELSLRINSLAGIHEELYQSDSFDQVDLGAYARGVVDQVVGLYPTQFELEMHIEAATINAPVDISVPVGLILSELVLNSVKHAFPGDRRGTLSVSMTRAGDQVELIVSDDGVGIPAEVGNGRQRGLGFELVRNLAEQIGADVSLSRDPGTRWQLTFSVPAAAPADRPSHRPVESDLE
jgi:two-component sensor histidine kinase